MYEDFLREHGITKYRLAEISGISYSVIQDLFSGKTSVLNCSYDTVHTLAQSLTMETEDFARKFALETFTAREDGEEIHVWVYRVGDTRFVIETDREGCRHLKMNFALTERTAAYLKDVAQMTLHARLREEKQRETERRLDELYRKETGHGQQDVLSDASE